MENDFSGKYRWKQVDLLEALMDCKTVEEAQALEGGNSDTA